MSGEDAGAAPGASADFWERHYRQRARPSSGSPNPVLADVALPMDPGTALELGCGLGDDAIWLATRGWRVTAVDVSDTALARAAARAAGSGVAARMAFEQHDLTCSFPDGAFDLVSAVHLESPVAFGRDLVLRRAAAAVAAGGLLLVVTHGSVRPWAWNAGQDTRFPTPAESLSALDLDPGAWETGGSGAFERRATGPDGQSATVTDIVIVARRRPVAASASQHPPPAR